MSIDETLQPRCYICGETKPLKMFASNKNVRHGRELFCKDCRLRYRSDAVARRAATLAYKEATQQAKQIRRENGGKQPWPWQEARNSRLEADQIAMVKANEEYQAQLEAKRIAKAKAEEERQVRLEAQRIARIEKRAQTTEKQCKKCSRILPVKMFAGNMRQEDGLHHTCGTCLGKQRERVSQRAKANAAKHREAANARKEAYRSLPYELQEAITAAKHADRLLRNEARKAYIEAPKELRPLLAILQDQQLKRGKEKQCNRCGETKPLELFDRDGGGYPGLCKACVFETSKAYRETNKEIIKRKLQAHRKAHPEVFRARNKAYVAENRAKIKARRRAYHAANRERINAWRRVHYTANKEKTNARRRDWNAKNPDKLRAYRQNSTPSHPDVVRAARHRRRSRLKGIIGSFTGAEIKAMRDIQNGCCVYCQRHVALLTIDHIVPITRNGRGDISNICLACRKCNSSKGAKLLEEWVNRWYERDR